MKKSLSALLLALILCLTAAVVPVSAEPLDNETTVIITRTSGQTELTPSQTESCFWEYPTLTAGQHRDDGVLWLFNKSGKDATVTMADFHLPTGDEQVTNYLKALHLTVRAGGKVVFDDTYDKAGSLSITVNVPKGEKKPVYYELGCDFTYSGESTLGNDVIYGKYSVEYHGGGIFSSWIFYAVVGAVVLAAIIVVVVLKKKQKSA
ncbi:MAG: hypothetical protein MJ083_04215 [Clostridia bacterium]|nr:hypothetical protein [Clostridia bacterium]